VTVAISLKVHEGLVLAADSASTLFGVDPSGRPAVINVYDHACKLFNLYKGLPIGGLTWGAGSIGHAALSTLSKDLRRLFMGSDEAWSLDRSNYTVEQVADSARRFFFEETYMREFKDRPDKPSLGFLVAGYSAGDDLPEEWKIEILGGNCPAPTAVRQRGETGIFWAGEQEAIARIVKGHGTGLPRVLAELGVPEEQIGPAMEQIEQRLEVMLAAPPMPIQDAIDLAVFLVEATIMFSRFSPGAPTVGGRVDVAAITKHEGFKWIRRKHYFDAKYNP